MFLYYLCIIFNLERQIISKKTFINNKLSESKKLKYDCPEQEQLGAWHCSLKPKGTHYGRRRSLSLQDPARKSLGCQIVTKIEQFEQKQSVVNLFYPKICEGTFLLYFSYFFLHKWRANLHGFSNICKIPVVQTFKVMQSKIF